MESHEMRRRLEQLHHELQRIETVDESERAILLQLMADIQDLLAHGGGVEAEQVTRFGKRWRSRIAEVETSYPKAALVMGQVIDTLAAIGF